ncbi:hypothetical protein J4E85_001021 [Alternaria conjuncta]|uniref:uncharacterized protein n=1 Tax=Alternaria conjuncta TaxID=181017 RepID=UPI00221E4DFE|nr:uncharacterized protein J4E85_001021 [Alternaria conjuncta]KAI4938580.1 hypothetical protein J4E85_001021 [Alternaria conjuncta]
MTTALGVVADTVSLWTFAAGIFGGQQRDKTVVRVAAALNGGSGYTSDGDGDVGAIRLYSESQQLIGNTAGNYVGSGNYKDFSINQADNKQAPYVQVAAGTNAICIPYVSTTWADGNKYAWVGDFGAVCGLDWYYGNLYVAASKAKPRCTWIDSDHNSGLKAGMLFIHFPSFQDTSDHGTNAHDYCHFPSFRAYTNANGGGNSIFSRDTLDASAQNVKRAVDSRIVVTADPGHNATELCASGTSRGPDLVSLYENVYCDMDTRRTLPVCGDGIVTDCFDVETKQELMRSGKRSQKEFSDVITWD